MCTEKKYKFRNIIIHTLHTNMGTPETMPSSDFSFDNAWERYTTIITRIEAVVVGRSVGRWRLYFLKSITMYTYFGGIGDTASILTDCWLFTWTIGSCWYQSQRLGMILRFGCHSGTYVGEFGANK